MAEYLVGIVRRAGGAPEIVHSDAPTRVHAADQRKRVAHSLAGDASVEEVAIFARVEGERVGARAPLAQEKKNAEKAAAKAAKRKTAKKKTARASKKRKPAVQAEVGKVEDKKDLI